jgi:hypothetical protein
VILASWIWFWCGLVLTPITVSCEVRRVACVEQYRRSQFTRLHPQPERDQPPLASTIAERLTLVAAVRGILPTNSTVLGTL